MNNLHNSAPPLIMHIDLNSCFATVEQQARPRLRGRPVAVLNRRTEHTMIITASYEAKAMGVKLGMKFLEAKKLCPDLVGVESDPAKYRYVYHRLMDIMNDYSAHVRMKSIDEGVIDFSESPHVAHLIAQGQSLSKTEAKQRGGGDGTLQGWAQVGSIHSAGFDLEQARAVERMVEVGREIKQRLRDEVGCAMRCNVGISTNRFLAKVAAGLHKPDGLDVITQDNIRQIFGELKLTDLTGIAGRMEHRLNAVGIYTPLEFLDASEETLRRQVYKSIDGTAWHNRLRGWEVDKRDFPIRTAGRQYVLERFDLTFEEILQRLHHLCEETGTKIRSQGLVARGVMVHARVRSDKEKGWYGKYWRARHMSSTPFSSDAAIYAIARQLFEQAPSDIKEIGVSCYELHPPDDTQLQLFADDIARERAITSAIDGINSRWGKRIIHSADTLPTAMVKAKIPFGSTRYL